MAHIIKDRVLEQSTTAGLGAFTLAGAALGFRAFASVCSVSDTVWYYIEAIDSLGKPSGAYEYGIGTYSGANTLTRTTVLGSSNAGSAVDFAAGTKLVGMGVVAPGPETINGQWRRAMGLFPRPADYGAVGDGSADDNAAIVAMVAGQETKVFKFGPVTLSNNQWLDFNYQRAKSNAAVAHMVKLTNFAPVVSRMYVSDATGATYAFVVGASRFPRLTDLWILNCSGGGINFDPDASSTNKPIIRDIVIEGFATNGVNIETNVSEINAANVYIDSGTTAAGSGAIPKRGTVGWKQNTPVGAVAVGGHLLTQVTVIDSEVGFHFTDAQLTTLVNCIADSTASYGVRLDGACVDMTFNAVFVGTSMGVYVGGTSSNINFSSLNTSLTGVIPPWGDATFYLAAGPYYDVTVADTAEVKIEGDSWFGRKQVSVAAGATLNVNGGERRLWDTNGTIAAGSTVYLDDDGVGANEGDTVFRMPFDGYIFSMDCYADGSPGGSDTFTYTVRVTAADTALTATISAAGTNVRAYPATAIFAAKGASVTIKLVTSATATARRHTGNLHILGV